MIPPMLLLVVYSFAKRGAAQTTTSTPSVTPVPEGCGGCSLAPATTDTTIYNTAANRQESFILFTGYNIASQILSAGQCQLTLGSWISLSPIYSVSQRATVISAEAQSTAIDLFYSYLGFSECSGSGEDVTLSALSSLPATSLITAPTAPNPSSPTAVTSGPNQNSAHSNVAGTNSSDNSFTQSKKVKISLGSTIPVASLGLVLLGYLVYRRRKVQGTLEEEDATSKKEGSQHEDQQPYLQQKAELEAEEKRKYELEARERRYEIGVEGERYELPVEGQDMMIRTRQELRGEEHSTELGVPQSH